MNLGTVSGIEDLCDDVRAWRRHLHAHPELGFEVQETAGFVADKLREFGFDDVVTNFGRSGVVGILKGRGGGPTIGFRADMDALPINEETNRPWASKVSGRMHACGHDGHTAMLLGAARHLSATRDFNGRLAFIFQPAEEDGGGGQVMVEDGLMERFSISKVFAMHSLPGLSVGKFATRHGAIMAATLEFIIRIQGIGGHAAIPHATVDPIVIGSQIVLALQTIVSRNTDPLESLVVSVTKFGAGTAFNVISGEAEISGTIRSLSSEAIETARQRILEISRGQASLMGGSAQVEFVPSYPATINHAVETEIAARVAESVVGEGAVDTNARPMMGGEDFSYMLEARPGAYLFIGNGEGPNLHHPGYDFNDDAIPYGVSCWIKLAAAFQIS